MSETEDEQKNGKEEFVSKNQHLFLAEFLIETVNLDPKSFPEEALEGQTCLTLKFLDFPPMKICEKDFDPNKEPSTDKIRFNSGKSLMFALSEKQCEEPPLMMAEILVGKKSCDENTKDVDLGKIKLCMMQLFQYVYDIAKSTPDKLPASKSIKDCFMIVGRGKRTTGEVGIYVRLTCLGQNVVTEFQCGANMKQNPVLFKNREGKKVYEFTGANKEDEEEGEEEGEEGDCAEIYGGLKCPPQKYPGGCGCLDPPPSSTKRPGGQGDAGSGPRRTPASGTYTKGNGVNAPPKPNHGAGEKTACRRKQLESGNGPTGSLKGKGMTSSQMIPDPDRNCFVLKVGDKGQIPDRGKMIIEFQTPKQKILPKVIPPYHEDIAVQTDSGKKSKKKSKKPKKK